MPAPEYCLEQYRRAERHAHVVACHRDSRGSAGSLAGILARCRHLANVVPEQLVAGATERRHCVPGPALVVTLTRSGVLASCGSNVRHLGVSTSQSGAPSELRDLVIDG